jgi:hypothetical protein
MAFEPSNSNAAEHFKAIATVLVILSFGLTKNSSCETQFDDGLKALGIREEYHFVTVIFASNSYLWYL